MSARKPPEKAWHEVALALVRVVALSQASNHNWCGVIPTDFFIFGSMLNPTKKDYGDADICIGRMFSCERNKQFEKTQQEWLKNYSCYIPEKAINPYKVLETEINQQILMIKNSKNFLSIHDTSDPSNLSSENKDFPILKIWEYSNDMSIDLFDEHDIKNRELSINWENNNPREAKGVIQNLNNALIQLELPSISSSNFKEKCKKYQINILASELVEELNKFTFTEQIFNFESPQSLFDCKIKKISNIVLSGELGFEALGIAFRKLNIPNDNNTIKNFLKTPNDHYIEQTNFLSCFHNGWNNENSKLELQNSKNKVIKNIQLMRKSNTEKKKKKNEL